VRALIDARPALEARSTGVGHYTRRVIRYLPVVDRETEYVAWYLHARGLLRPRRFFSEVAAPNLAEAASRFPARIFEPISSRIGVPRIEWLVGFDVLLATNFLPPATSRREVVLVVHDLAYRRFPETAPHIDERWRRRFERAVEDSAAVIVPSASTKRDLLDACPVDEVRVHVVPHGVDTDEFAPAPASAIEEVRRRFGIEGPYALFIGGIEPRKNLDTLLRAFAGVEPPAVLVIAGGPVRWDPKAAERLDAAVERLPEPTRRRVVRTGYVSGAEKRALMSDATVLAYPSLYEGFGFPILEAFAAGVPVLTSDVSAMPEVAGDAAALVDPRDVDAIAAGLGELFADKDLRGVLRAAGIARASRFTWVATARATADVLHGAAASVASSPGG
jgi:glycosyltransferase involved in cell wall biosynthesis